MMDPLSIFVLQLVLSTTVFAIAAKWYVVPWLAGLTNDQALTILIFPHAMRHIGLLFLVPGIVAQPLPDFFAYTAAYGDLISGLLALLAIIVIRKGRSIAIPLVWIFNIIGTVDLLNALRHAELVPDLGATWYIPTFFVPLLLVTHAMIFMRLLKYESKKLIAV
jgi:hypothetical protein